MRRTCAVVASIALVGCSAATQPDRPAPLAGTWAPVVAEVPGITYTLTLTVADSVVTGSGQWRLPIGASGRILVAGTTSGALVKLRVRLLQPGDNSSQMRDTLTVFPFLDERFEGQQSSPTRLRGTLTGDALTGPFEYVRVGGL